MSCNIIREFKTKDGKAEELLALLEKLVPETLHRGGVINISIERNQDNPNHIISNQYWESRKHYEDYCAWRDSIGTTAVIDKLLAEPSFMTYFDVVFVARPPGETSRVRLA